MRRDTQRARARSTCSRARRERRAACARVRDFACPCVDSNTVLYPSALGAAGISLLDVYLTARRLRSRDGDHPACGSPVAVPVRPRDVNATTFSLGLSLGHGVQLLLCGNCAVSLTLSHPPTSRSSHDHAPSRLCLHPPRQYAHPITAFRPSPPPAASSLRPSASRCRLPQQAGACVAAP